jgi:hypothetical protein
MAKSRRNVSRRKRQQKRRNSRRNFRKMLRGGGLISDVNENKLIEELKKLKSDTMTDEMINKTIEQLKENNKWENYSPFGTINIDKIQEIIKNLKEKEKEENNSLNPPS